MAPPTHFTLALRPLQHLQSVLGIAVEDILKMEGVALHAITHPTHSTQAGTCTLLIACFLAKLSTILSRRMHATSHAKILLKNPEMA
jgi:hypothetical protein